MGPSAGPRELSGSPGQDCQVPLPPHFGGNPAPVAETAQEFAVVCGRLADRGRPLVACQVVIVPLKKYGQNYRLDDSRTPLRTTTDAEGIYYFENVPLGDYKMMWLPSGTRQWIRRISLRPDVLVKHEGINRVKDIRIALQTAN